MLLVGLTATVAATVGSYQSLERDREARFDGAAERARGAVGESLQLHMPTHPVLVRACPEPA